MKDSAMDRKWLLSRRALLGGIGAFGASSILRPGMAHAAAAPPRLLVVHVPEGMWNGAPRPVAGASTFGPIFDALDPYRDWILALNNLNMVSRDKGPGGDGHHRGVPHMFTGTEMADASNAGGPSVDQKIAQTIGSESRFQSVQLAVRIVYGDTNGRPIWSAAKRAVPAQGSPFEAYKRLFASVQPTAPTKPAFDLKKSALDHSLAELNALRGRLAASDRERLDSYHDSLRSVEKRLVTATSPGPAGCVSPSLGGAIDVKQEANYPKVGQLQMDLVVAAFQCGLTRVASLQWGNSNDQCSYSFLGVNEQGHDLAHNTGNCDPGGSKKLKVYQWYSKQFAYLMQKLLDTKDPDGSPMLANTVILWASEFGDSNGHSSNKLLWFLAGNANNAFKLGRTVDCGGKSVNDLHTSLCNTFGVAGKFGNPAYCAGPLQALYG